MLLEDGETRTRGCKNLEIKNFMYPTPPWLDFQPFCEHAFLAPHDPRPPCAPSFIKSRTLRIFPTHFLLFLKFLVCIHVGNIRVPSQVLASGPKPCGGNNNVISFL